MLLFGPRNLDAAQAAYNKREFRKARRIWYALAQRGDHRAQCKLANMYHSGIGVSQDVATAVMWYRKAASQGNTEAQAWLNLRDQQRINRRPKALQTVPTRGNAPVAVKPAPLVQDPPFRPPPQPRAPKPKKPVADEPLILTDMISTLPQPDGNAPATPEPAPPTTPDPAPPSPPEPTKPPIVITATPKRAWRPPPAPPRGPIARPRVKAVPPPPPPPKQRRPQPATTSDAKPPAFAKPRAVATNEPPGPLANENEPPLDLTVNAGPAPGTPARPVLPKVPPPVVTPLPSPGFSTRPPPAGSEVPQPTEQPPEPQPEPEVEPEPEADPNAATELPSPFVLKTGTGADDAPDPLREAQQAYDAGNFTAAHKQWSVLAEDGIAEAQAQLAMMYDDGVGVDADPAQAIRWYHRAARQGHPKAQTNLGVIYGAPGLNGRRDLTQAALWTRRAAAQAVPRAQYNLGIMYALGDGVPVDFVDAYMWFSLADARGFEEAGAGMAELERHMSSAQLALARSRQKHWRPQSPTKPKTPDKPASAAR